MIWGNSWFYSFDGNQDKGTWLSFEDAIYIRSWAHLQFDMIVGLSFCSLLCMSYVWYRWCINPKNRDVEMRQIRYRQWRKYWVLRKLLFFFDAAIEGKVWPKLFDPTHPPPKHVCNGIYWLFFVTHEKIKIVGILYLTYFHYHHHCHVGPNGKRINWIVRWRQPCIENCPSIEISGEIENWK